MAVYEVLAAGRTVGRGSLSEAQAAVMNVITAWLAEDPDSAAQGALMAKQAFAAGTVQHSLRRNGTWRTTVAVAGEMRVITVSRHAWWRRFRQPPRQ